MVLETNDPTASTTTLHVPRPTQRPSFHVYFVDRKICPSNSFELEAFAIISKLDQFATYQTVFFPTLLQSAAFENKTFLLFNS